MASTKNTRKRSAPKNATKRSNVSLARIKTQKQTPKSNKKPIKKQQSQSTTESENDFIEDRILRSYEDHTRRLYRVLLKYDDHGKHPFNWLPETDEFKVANQAEYAAFHKIRNKTKAKQKAYREKVKLEGRIERALTDFEFENAQSADYDKTYCKYDRGYIDGIVDQTIIDKKRHFRVLWSPKWIDMQDAVDHHRGLVLEYLLANPNENGELRLRFNRKYPGAVELAQRVSEDANRNEEEDDDDSIEIDDSEGSDTLQSTTTPNEVPNKRRKSVRLMGK